MLCSARHQCSKDLEIQLTAGTPCLNSVDCSSPSKKNKICGITVCCRAKLRGAPLAPGCVTVFVRHGDKGKEAKLYEDFQYEDALKQLHTLEPSLTRQVFLSTDDPVTVQYFTNVTRSWKTTYVDMPRKPDRYEGDWHNRQFDQHTAAAPGACSMPMQGATISHPPQLFALLFWWSTSF